MFSKVTAVPGPGAKPRVRLKVAPSTLMPAEVTGTLDAEAKLAVAVFQRGKIVNVPTSVLSVPSTLVAVRR